MATQLLSHSHHSCVLSIWPSTIGIHLLFLGFFRLCSSPLSNISAYSILKTTPWMSFRMYCSLWDHLYTIFTYVLFVQVCSSPVDVQIQHLIVIQVMVIFSI